MTPLRQRMLEELKVRGRSPNTCRSYIEKIAKFAKHFGKSPEQLGPDEVRAYQLYLIEYKRGSRSQVDSFVAAARFLYGVTLEKDWAVKKIPYPKRPKKLPEILSEGEVKTLLESVTNLKHRALLMTMYAAALRVSEACKLTIRDVDSKRMAIRIRQGKGMKDRYVPLAGFLLRTLRAYWKCFQPKPYLFPGRRGRPITTRHVYRVCVDAGREARIAKHTNPHCLRHSCATHMLERGANILDVQAILGHASLESTLHYLHLSSKTLSAAPSPLDIIMKNDDIIKDDDEESAA